MPERRQAHRRDPIQVEIRGEVMEARPLPWFDRNDLGNEVLRQYSEMLNSMMKSYVDQDSGAPSLELLLNDKLMDPIKILEMGYPEVGNWGDYEYDEIYELIFATLDVNDLSNLRELVDPNSETPTSNGGTNSSGIGKLQRIVGTQKEPSTPSLSSQDSPEVMSSTSPMEKSSTSSEKETESSGTNDGGS